MPSHPTCRVVHAAAARRGETPLMHAALYSGHADTIELLVQMGATVNAHDDNG
jgi:hypothetical protein